MQFIKEVSLGRFKNPKIYFAQGKAIYFLGNLAHFQNSTKIRTLENIFHLLIICLTEQLTLQDWKTFQLTVEL